MSCWKEWIFCRCWMEYPIGVWFKTHSICSDNLTGIFLCWFFGVGVWMTSVGECGVLKSSTIIVSGPIYPFMTNNICFMKVLVHRYLKLLVHFSFANTLWPSLSHLTDFGLKSPLLDMSKTTPACFQSPFAWNIMFCPLIFSLCIFVGEMCFLQAAKNCVLVFNLVF